MNGAKGVIWERLISKRSCLAELFLKVFFDPGEGSDHRNVTIINPPAALEREAAWLCNLEFFGSVCVLT